MKLQLALDLELKKALKICKKTKKYIDIIEIGTPLVKQEGLKSIKKFKKYKKPILADLKTMDTGALEAGLGFKAGAEIVTVCANAPLPTIKTAIKESKKNKKKILVDLIGVKNIKKRAKEILKLNPTYIGVHTGIDQQNKGKSPLSNLKKISKLTKPKKIAVAGGINLKDIREVVKFKPEIIIVGGAITKSKNPEQVAKELKKIMKNEK